jgi:hypothetical protein
MIFILTTPKLNVSYEALVKLEIAFLLSQGDLSRVWRGGTLSG